MITRLISCSVIALLLLAFVAGIAQSRSAYSPRQSGIEPPGGPRNTGVLPGRSISRTPDGGMGYVDAYGNSLTDRLPEEKKARHRPRPGAYGAPAKVEDNYLPDPGSGSGKPLWGFQ